MNSFGAGYVEGVSSLRQFTLVDPAGVTDARARFNRAAVADLRRVNRFHCPAGREAFRGHILLPRYEYDQLNKYSTVLQLHIGDTTNPNNVGTLKNLAIVQARCVTSGLAADRNALYLVELTDARGIVANRWFAYPINAMYNIRAPAYPSAGGGTFMTASMNSGTTWTWATMLRDIWETMGSILGVWPGLPYAPAGTPEGFWFNGVPAWGALNDILDHLGMAVAADLTSAAPYTIVERGATDAALALKQARFVTNLEDDEEWIDVGAGRVPGSVVVLFRRRNEVYGTEETVRRDALQWSTNAVYSVTVAAPDTFAGAVGAHHIWSDHTVRYDQDGVIVAADAARAAQIAAERAAQYYDRIYAGTAGAMAQVYAGALPFATGSLVDAVTWYRDGAYPGGWRTRIARGAYAEPNDGR